MSAPGARALFGALLLRPAACFAIISLVFGSFTLAVTPPLRGPDENAHFLRAYGIASGAIVPSRVDERGRKGIDLPPAIARDFRFWDAARERKAGEPGFSYRGLRMQVAHGRAAADGAPEFTPYGGSEGYSPVPYLPYVAAGLAARLFGLDFTATLYLMRAAGLLAFTAIAGYAIALAPRLPWALVAIATLPSALYGRSVVNADGAVLGTTLVVLVLSWRAALGLRTAAGGPRARAVWMTLCALTKPSQVAFTLLEAMAWRPGDLKRGWPRVALVIVPPLVLAPLWIVAAGGDIGAWRVYENSGVSPHEFSPAWKLRFMLAHPGHFPRAALQSLDYAGELWRQLIGVLGWLDTRLQPWVYAVLSAVLLLACCEPPRDGEPWRVPVVAGLTALAYTAAVLLIFYLTYTPVSSDRVLGLQGRYFIVALPLVAIVLSRWLPGLPSAVVGGTAIAGTLVSGWSVAEAVLRTDWPAVTP